MTEKRCDYCNSPFVPREAAARFCRPECREEFWKDERRQAMELRRQQREAVATYFSRAQFDEDAPRGRFAKPAATIVGTEPCGPQLPAPAWTRDPTGTEPPLGYDVNELPALGGAGCRQ